MEMVGGGAVESLRGLWRFLKMRGNCVGDFGHAEIRIYSQKARSSTYMRFVCFSPEEQGKCISDFQINSSNSNHMYEVFPFYPPSSSLLPSIRLEHSIIISFIGQSAILY